MRALYEQVAPARWNWQDMGYLARVHPLELWLVRFLHQRPGASLAEAIDASGADLVVHGHAHRGSERGLTRGGVRVRNVAQPVIRAAYRVYEVHPTDRAAVAAAADQTLRAADGGWGRGGALSGFAGGFGGAVSETIGIYVDAAADRAAGQHQRLGAGRRPDRGGHLYGAQRGLGLGPAELAVAIGGLDPDAGILTGLVDEEQAVLVVLVRERIEAGRGCHERQVVVEAEPFRDLGAHARRDDLRVHQRREHLGELARRYHPGDQRAGRLLVLRRRQRRQRSQPGGPLQFAAARPLRAYGTALSQRRA